ncbi:hypothetical protein HELRODRAFT_159629 [Helobdella robusta]|uniref:Uncharacterized protein n=1 Tax=Helobdella robusta TaxID=6412 RepID=T1EP95_HELRO|nr:hypothetical protein HELRODRAFT_159629 [Helobdella robusta]ESO13034.1 hypothetical protein HELRODRAFT_159629 [Helobdella robusta]
MRLVDNDDFKSNTSSTKVFDYPPRLLRYDILAAKETRKQGGNLIVASPYFVCNDQDLCPFHPVTNFIDNSYTNDSFVFSKNNEQLNSQMQPALQPEAQLQVASPQTFLLNTPTKITFNSPLMPIPLLQIDFESNVQNNDACNDVCPCNYLVSNLSSEPEPICNFYPGEFVENCQSPCCSSKSFSVKSKNDKESIPLSLYKVLERRKCSSKIEKRKTCDKFKVLKSDDSDNQENNVIKKLSSVLKNESNSKRRRSKSSRRSSSRSRKRSLSNRRSSLLNTNDSKTIHNFVENELKSLDNENNNKDDLPKSVKRGELVDLLTKLFRALKRESDESSKGVHLVKKRSRSKSKSREKSTEELMMEKQKEEHEEALNLLKSLLQKKKLTKTQGTGLDTAKNDLGKQVLLKYTNAIKKCEDDRNTIKEVDEIIKKCKLSRLGKSEDSFKCNQSKEQIQLEKYQAEQEKIIQNQKVKAIKQKFLQREKNQSSANNNKILDDESWLSYSDEPIIVDEIIQDQPNDVASNNSILGEKMLQKDLNLQKFPGRKKILFLNNEHRQQILQILQTPQQNQDKRDYRQKQFSPEHHTARQQSSSLQQRSSKQRKLRETSLLKSNSPQNVTSEQTLADEHTLGEICSLQTLQNQAHQQHQRFLQVAGVRMEEQILKRQNSKLKLPRKETGHYEQEPCLQENQPMLQQFEEQKLSPARQITLRQQIPELKQLHDQRLPYAQQQQLFHNQQHIPQKQQLHYDQQILRQQHQLHQQEIPQQQQLHQQEIPQQQQLHQQEIPQQQQLHEQEQQLKQKQVVCRSQATSTRELNGTPQIICEQFSGSFAEGQELSHNHIKSCKMLSPSFNTLSNNLSASETNANKLPTDFSCDCQVNNEHLVQSENFHASSKNYQNEKEDAHVRVPACVGCHRFQKISNLPGSSIRSNPQNYAQSFIGHQNIQQHSLLKIHKEHNKLKGSLTERSTQHLTSNRITISIQTASQFCENKHCASGQTTFNNTIEAAQRRSPLKEIKSSNIPQNATNQVDKKIEELNCNTKKVENRIKGNNLGTPSLSVQQILQQSSQTDLNRDMKQMSVLNQTTNNQSSTSEFFSGDEFHEEHVISTWVVSSREVLLGKEHTVYNNRTSNNKFIKLYNYRKNEDILHSVESDQSHKSKSNVLIDQAVEDVRRDHGGTKETFKTFVNCRPKMNFESHNTSFVREPLLEITSRQANATKMDNASMQTDFANNHQRASLNHYPQQHHKKQQHKHLQSLKQIAPIQDLKFKRLTNNLFDRFSPRKIIMQDDERSDVSRTFSETICQSPPQEIIKKTATNKFTLKRIECMEHVLELPSKFNVVKSDNSICPSKMLFNSQQVLTSRTEPILMNQAEVVEDNEGDNTTRSAFEKHVKIFEIEDKTGLKLFQ